MNTKKTILWTTIIIFVIITCCYITTACNKGKGDSTTSKKDAKGSKLDSKPLNISIFIDLSDRLERDNVTPSQMNRDLAIVENIVDYFKDRTEKKIKKSKNKIKVLFYPIPKSTDIATLASNLSIDMESFNPKDMKRQTTLDNMKKDYKKYLTKIYQKAIEDGKENKWPGCELWDFFSSKKVDAHCVRKDYRNILIILTDGYLYDENGSKDVVGKARAFITPKVLKEDPNAELLSKRDGLDDLEVRMMEVNPYDKPQSYQLKPILENWLKAMGVRQENITVAETDLPSNTQIIIESFLEE